MISLYDKHLTHSYIIIRFCDLLHHMHAMKTKVGKVTRSKEGREEGKDANEI